MSAQSGAIRLDNETAARPLDNGEWYIFAYEDDQGEIHEMIRAGHLVLSEVACAEFAAAICDLGDGCDLLKDLLKDLKTITERERRKDAEYGRVRSWRPSSVRLGPQ